MMNKEKSFVPKESMSLEGFVTVQDGVAVTLNKLKRMDLSTISPNVSLRMNIDSLTVLIHREETLRVRLVYKVKDDHPWAKKYGANEMSRAMSDVTGRMPDEILPLITASAWVRPCTVSWEFALPLTTTSKELLKAIQTSLDSVKILALGLLMRRWPKASEVAHSTGSVLGERTKAK